MKEDLTHTIDSMSNEELVELALSRLKEIRKIIEELMEQQ